MKISKIHIREFMGISDFSAELNPGVNVVKGRNGSGKSSFLKAILKTLAGKGKTDGPWVIHRLRNGELSSPMPASSAAAEGQPQENVAEILVELDNQVKVLRQIRNGGTKLQVTQRKGPLDVEVAQSRQFLEAMLPENHINPIEFFKGNAAERRKVLLRIVPSALGEADIRNIFTHHGIPGQEAEEAINSGMAKAGVLLSKKVGLEAISHIDASVMEMRRGAWAMKEHHEEAAVAEANKLPVGYKFEEQVPDTASILKQIEEANRTAEASQAAKRSLTAAMENLANLHDAKVAVEDEMRQLKVKLDRILHDITLAEKRLGEAKARDAEAASNVADAAPLKAELLSLEERRKHSFCWKEAKKHEELREFYADLVRKYDTLMQKGLREEAPRLLWSRLEETPLASLNIGMEEDRITCGGVDIDNCSESEQIRIALAIARSVAESSQLKLICVDGFEALDPDTRAEFARQASSDGFQYVVAEVSSGDLRIEDGNVKEG